MPQIDEQVRENVRKATVKTDTIRLAASDPRLVNKLKIDIDDPYQTVSWYIRFNLDLDTESVNRKTMRVAETNGYILDAEISYNEQNKSIILQPLEMYEQNAFYILYISGKVKSAKGNYLRKKIHILFKLSDNRITEFKILQSTAKVPKLKKKPAHLKRALPAPKFFADEQEIAKSVEKGKLPFAPIRMNVWLALLGIAVMCVSVYFLHMYAAAAGVVLCIAGMIHIFVQLSRPAMRSVFAYNHGTSLFNAGHYMEAELHFAKALRLDERNELAEYAAQKVRYFIEE